jgi:hypothetical protein
MDVNQILAVVLPLVLPPLIGAVTLFVKGEIAKLPGNIEPVVSSLAGQAVAAVEQTMQGTAGDAKFAAASYYLSASLKRIGISLDPNEIKSVIEEAVYYLNQAQGKSPVAAAAPAEVAQPVPATQPGV